LKNKTATSGHLLVLHDGEIHGYGGSDI